MEVESFYLCPRAHKESCFQCERATAAASPVNTAWTVMVGLMREFVRETEYTNRRPLYGKLISPFTVKSLLHLTLARELVPYFLTSRPENSHLLRVERAITPSEPSRFWDTLFSYAGVWEMKGRRRSKIILHANIVEKRLTNPPKGPDALLCRRRS